MERGSHHQHEAHAPSSRGADVDGLLKLPVNSFPTSDRLHTEGGVVPCVFCGEIETDSGTTWG